jgi:hypothetical protein
VSPETSRPADSCGPGSSQESSTSTDTRSELQRRLFELHKFTLANSQHPNHTVQTRVLHRYLDWHNANARHPDILAAQRRERARIRSEKGIRWGGRPLSTAA